MNNEKIRYDLLILQNTTKTTARKYIISYKELFNSYKNCEDWFSFLIISINYIFLNFCYYKSVIPKEKSTSSKVKLI